MKEYWVDVRFTVKADDEGDAVNKVHEFVPDVEEEGDIIMWTLANSLIAKIPTCYEKEDPGMKWLEDHADDAAKGLDAIVKKMVEEGKLPNCSDTPTKET